MNRKRFQHSSGQVDAAILLVLVVFVALFFIYVESIGGSVAVSLPSASQ